MQWCKDRALEYADKGQIGNAWVSFVSDMKKHDETRDHVAIALGTAQFIGGMLNGPGQMRNFIEGFN